MSPLFKKLNLKQHNPIVILNAPDSFRHETAQLTDVKILSSLDQVAQVDFALVFATTQADVNACSLALQDKASDDATLWFAYPKGTSKKYRCDFNRDTGWEVLRRHGFDSVRMVAIDEDWSALRFRRNEYISR